MRSVEEIKYYPTKRERFKSFPCFGKENNIVLLGKQPFKFHHNDHEKISKFFVLANALTY
jgi:hypothetical protein